MSVFTIGGAIIQLQRDGQRGSQSVTTTNNKLLYFYYILLHKICMIYLHKHINLWLVMSTVQSVIGTKNTQLNNG